MCRIRFLDTDSSRDKHDSPARTWSHPRHACPHPHAPARPRTPGRPKTTTTFLSQRGSNANFLDILSKGTSPKKHKNKTESEYRAQQQRGSNARYHQLRSAFLVCSSEVSVFSVETFYFSCDVGTVRDKQVLTKKTRKKKSQKHKLTGSSPQTLQLRSSLTGPAMVLRPGRRTSPSARLS